MAEYTLTRFLFYHLQLLSPHIHLTVLVLLNPIGVLHYYIFLQNIDQTSLTPHFVLPILLQSQLQLLSNTRPRLTNPRLYLSIAAITDISFDLA